MISSWGKITFSLWRHLFGFLYIARICRIITTVLDEIRSLILSLVDVLSNHVQLFFASLCFIFWYIYIYIYINSCLFISSTAKIAGFFHCLVCFSKPLLLFARIFHMDRIVETGEENILCIDVKRETAKAIA